MLLYNIRFFIYFEKKRRRSIQILRFKIANIDPTNEVDTSPFKNYQRKNPFYPQNLDPIKRNIPKVICLLYQTTIFL